MLVVLIMSLIDASLKMCATSMQYDCPYGCCSYDDNMHEVANPYVDDVHDDDDDDMDDDT